MDDQIIEAETAQNMLTKRYKELTFIRCAGSCTIFQFKDCLIQIRPADDRFSLEYVLTEITNG